MTLKLKDAAVTAKSWWQNGAVNQTARQGNTLPPQTTTGGVAHSVNSMTVHAGNVVVNGRNVSQGGTATPPATTGGQPNRSGTATSGTNAPRTTATAASSTLIRVGGALKVGGATATLIALFAAADVYTTRSSNEKQISETQAIYDQSKAIYDAIAEDPERIEE